MVETGSANDQTLEPVREYPLGKDWRDTSDLRGENEPGVFVDKGQANVSKKGEVLSSEDFFEGTGVILFNRDSGNAYLAHIRDSSPNYEQGLKMEEIEDETLDLAIINGKGSLLNLELALNPRSGFMEDFTRYSSSQIKNAKQIMVNSGERGWSVAFDPKTQIIKIYTRTDKTVREYKF